MSQQREIETSWSQVFKFLGVELSSFKKKVGNVWKPRCLVYVEINFTMLSKSS